MSETQFVKLFQIYYDARWHTIISEVASGDSKFISPSYDLRVVQCSCET